MAKGNMALGKLRGKMGGFVFRVDGGIGQVVSEYNGSPRNPRTLAQTEQRGKMNMAGKMSSLTPKSVLVGLNANNRNARSTFVGNILKNIVSTPTQNGFNYVLSAGNVVLSKGASSQLVATPTYASATNKISVAIVNNNLEQEMLGAIVMVYMTAGGEAFKYGVAKMATAASAGTFPTVEITAPADVSQGGGVAEIYIIPIVKVDGAASVFYSQFVEADVDNLDNFNASVSRTLSAMGAYGASIYGGSLLLGE